MASTKDGSSSGTATVTEEVRQSTEQLKQTAQQKAGEMTEQTKQQATSLAEGQKSQATQNLDSISGALRSTEQQLHSDGQKVAAQAVTMAASQVEKLSGYLQSHSVSEMVGEAEAFARRQPAAFLGGAFVLGFALSRFLKSTPSQGSSPSSYGSYSSDSSYGTGGMYGSGDVYGTSGSYASAGSYAPTTDVEFVPEDVSGMPSSTDYLEDPSGANDGISS
jgi:gas vesicle protein